MVTLIKDPVSRNGERGFCVRWIVAEDGFLLSNSPISRFISLFITTVLIVLITSCFYSLPAEPEVGKKVQIAVIPASDSRLSQNIADMLVTALRKDNYFIIVENSRLSG